MKLKRMKDPDEKQEGLSDELVDFLQSSGLHVVKKGNGDQSEPGTSDSVELGVRARSHAAVGRVPQATTGQPGLLGGLEQGSGVRRLVLVAEEHGEPGGQHLLLHVNGVGAGSVLGVDVAQGATAASGAG